MHESSSRLWEYTVSSQVQARCKDTMQIGSNSRWTYKTWETRISSQRGFSFCHWECYFAWTSFNSGHAGTQSWWCVTVVRILCSAPARLLCAESVLSVGVGTPLRDVVILLQHSEGFSRWNVISKQPIHQLFPSSRERWAPFHSWNAWKQINLHFYELRWNVTAGHSDLVLTEELFSIVISWTKNTGDRKRLPEP